MDSDFEGLIADDDEEIVDYLERPYIVRVRPNHMDQWDEQEFISRFRLAKNSYPASPNIPPNTPPKIFFLSRRFQFSVLLHFYSVRKMP